MEDTIKTGLLPTVLDIDVHHYVRDQSAGVNHDNHYSFDRSELKLGILLDLTLDSCGKIAVDSMTDTTVTIAYANSVRTLALGDEWKIGPFLVYNPYVSSDEATITIRYHKLTVREQMSELLDRILKIHEKTLHPLIPSTTDDEQRVLNLLDIGIEEGNVGLYPLKALLSACNNWYTCRILRHGLFESILLEGIEKGALAPDDAEGWEWLTVAAETNDPSEFMTDMDRYYDLLASAAENGNTDALDIMNEIWPPEQIIEED